MASKGGMEDTAIGQSALLQDILEDPTSFEFFQAVRVLERLLPDQTGIGGFGDPGEEVVRVGANPTISFPASEIQKLDIGNSGQLSFTVGFMGLIGPLGVLPFYYTLLVAERSRARDRALRDFFDIFNHRSISLFYRAWERNRFVIPYERDQRDPLTGHLRDIVGLGTKGIQDLFAVPDESLLFYTGLLGLQQRPAVALEQLIEDYFGVRAEIDQFVGGWYPLTVSTQCSLGDDTSASSRLGGGAVAGDEIWDQQARVRIRVGPLSRERYDEFLPTGSAYEELRALTRFFSDDRFDFEVQLILERDEVPGCVLDGDADVPAQLGWGTWMRSAPFSRDPDETVLIL